MRKHFDCMGVSWEPVLHGMMPQTGQVISRFEWKNQYKFRILYDKIDDPHPKILVLKIGHRRDFYSDFARYKELAE